MNDLRKPTSNAEGWILAMILAAAIFASFLMSGCQTVRGVASDTRTGATWIEQSIVPDNVPEKDIRIIYIDPNGNSQ